jgi:hypothetical protein
MTHRPPFRHPNPFKPAKGEFDALRAGTSSRPRWQTIVKIGLLVLLGVLIVGLHIVGILGAGLHAGGFGG